MLIKFINMKIKNNIRVDFSSKFACLEIYYFFVTNYVYASIYFRKLTIFFDTISYRNLHGKYEVFFKVKTTKVVFLNLSLLG